MTIRSTIEAAENGTLAPYAMRSADSSRRYAAAAGGRTVDYRPAFQRDRDRIIYSRAFRRLRQKAQSGLLPAYEDHRRNKLTHTLEACQFARTIGRSLRLNEDLVEAIALGHDLGQPPFGGAGERALDDLLSGRIDGAGGPGLGDLGGFSRARQSLRVVDRLEKRYEHPGLNLTDAVREGIFKSGPSGQPHPEEEEAIRPDLPPSFEAQTVRLADRIATALSDLDDAMQSKSVEIGQVERLRCVRELRRHLGAEYRPRAGRFMKANAIHRGLTHMLVTGAVVNSEKRLAAWAKKHGVKDYQRFREVRDEAVHGAEIALPKQALRQLEEIEGFLSRVLHRGYEADRVDGLGRRVVLGLHSAYYHDPALLEDHVLLRYKERTGVRYLRDVPKSRRDEAYQRGYNGRPAFVRVLADYLAGMTDAFALQEHQKLMSMGAIPIPGAEQLRREARHLD